MSAHVGACRKHFRTLALVALLATAGYLPGESAAQGDTCAGGQTPSTIVTFNNQSSNSIVLYWLNDQCEEVPYETLQPGAKVSQQTFAKHTWRVRQMTSQWLLREVTATTAPMTVRLLDLTAPLPRTEHERDDDAPGYYQVKVLYVLPMDAKDRHLDTKGQIARSIAAMQFWFSQQTAGRRIRLDAYDGAIDIGFVRLNRTEKELADYGAYIRDELEKELNKAFNHPKKVYLVYYDGAAVVCGNGPWPPELVGNVVALYLRAKDCGEPLARSVAEPSTWEFSAAHELLHALGFVPACAPNHTQAGHVSDSPNDLMYAGTRNWQPSILDVGRNDYFEHGNPSCPDLALSAFLDPLPDKAEIPPRWSK